MPSTRAMLVALALLAPALMGEARADFQATYDFTNLTGRHRLRGPERIMGRAAPDDSVDRRVARPPAVDHLTLKHLMIAVVVYAACLAALPVVAGLAAATLVLGLWLARSRAKPEDREGFLLRMLALIPVSFPPVLLATWLAECVALGHPPRGPADYEMEIHPLVTELALLCTLIWHHRESVVPRHDGLAVWRGDHLALG